MAVFLLPWHLSKVGCYWWSASWKAFLKSLLLLLLLCVYLMYMYACHGSVYGKVGGQFWGVGFLILLWVLQIKLKSLGFQSQCFIHSFIYSCFHSFVCSFLIKNVICVCICVCVLVAGHTTRQSVGVSSLHHVSLSFRDWTHITSFGSKHLTHWASCHPWKAFLPSLLWGLWFSSYSPFFLGVVWCLLVGMPEDLVLGPDFLPGSVFCSVM